MFFLFYIETSIGHQLQLAKFFLFFFALYFGLGTGLTVPDLFFMSEIFNTQNCYSWGIGDGEPITGLETDVFQNFRNNLESLFLDTSGRETTENVQKKKFPMDAWEFSLILR